MDSGATRDPGSCLGRYRIRSIVAAGKGATAYLCDDPLLGRAVVAYVPRLAPQDAGADDPRPTTIELALGARLNARLRHPNIVSVLDAGFDGEQPFLVLELVDGSSLAELVRGHNALHVPVALRLGASLAAAVHHLHEHGVVHADLTPANVLICKTGEPRIVDFTKAVPCAGVGQRDATVAATADTAPAAGATTTSIGTRVLDLWGLGVTLTEALTAMGWTEGRTVEQARAAVMQHMPELRAALPEAVTTLLERCLAGSEQAGFTGANELKRALEAVLAHWELEEARTVSQQPQPGRSLLLHVEYHEAERPGSYRQYVVQEHLGEGTHGDVYRAVDAMTHEPVAIKILKARWLGVEHAVERFRREAQILARVVHPNVVRIFNFGRYGHGFFIAMEYLGGPTLRSFMRERGPLSLPAAAKLVLPVLSGLGALAEAGIVHRDVKPSNVKIAGERVVLFDFGVSFAPDFEPLTATGGFVGTLTYAAPEQLSGQRITPATDVYAAAVMLYQLLSARLPFEADNEAALLLRIAIERPVPLRERRPNLGPAVHELLEAMLARAPGSRPSAVEAARALEVAAWGGRAHGDVERH